MNAKYRNKAALAFTTYGREYLQALVNDVWVSEAFDPGVKTESSPQRVRYKALWDTGATNTCITHQIVKDLGLQPIGRAIVSGVHGQREVSTYLINIILPNQVSIGTLRVTEAEISQADVLIGMDVIRHGDMAISNYNGRTIFSFRVPSIEEIDFVKEINKTKSKGISRTASTDELKKKRNRRKKEKQRKRKR